MSKNYNINTRIYNSEYLKQFIADLKYRLRGALLGFTDFREEIIKEAFLKSFAEKLSSLNIRLSAEISIMSNLRSLMIDNHLFKKDFEESILIVNKLKTSIKDINRLINSIGSSTNFVDLFNLKKKSKISTNPNVITFGEIIKTFKLDMEDSDSISDFKLYMRMEGIIISDADGLISWKQLSQLISNYDNASDIKKILALYHLEIEDIYDNIIDYMQEHAELIIGNEHSFKIYMSHYKTKLDKINHKLISKNNLANLNKLLKKDVIIKDLQDKLVDNAREIDDLSVQAEILERSYKREIAKHAPSKSTRVCEPIVMPIIGVYTDEMHLADLELIASIEKNMNIKDVGIIDPNDSDYSLDSSDDEPVYDDSIVPDLINFE
jgi:hypothetical protein